MNRLITIEELKELKDKLKSEKATDNDYNKIYSLFPDVKELEKEKPVELVKKDNSKLADKKAGFSNVIYLATLSLVFEICFLALSLIIYK